MNVEDGWMFGCKKPPVLICEKELREPETAPKGMREVTGDGITQPFLEL